MELKKYLLKKVAKYWPPLSRRATLATGLGQKPEGKRLIDSIRNEQAGLAQTRIMENMGKPPPTINRKTNIRMINGIQNTTKYLG
ncbi:MAG: hypothetical protein KKD44_28950 [Proteobacteria bacterium]|nr:hypothetical protein [Pseudomonadota bacterium]